MRDTPQTPSPPTPYSNRGMYFGGEGVREMDDEKRSEQKVFKKGSEKALRKNISNEQGEDMAKGLKVDDGIGIQIVVAFATIWGLVTFLNPERYSIFRILIQNIQVQNPLLTFLASIDYLVGLAVAIIGGVILFSK
jgi:hypothetical protein